LGGKMKKKIRGGGGGGVRRERREQELNVAVIPMVTAIHVPLLTRCTQSNISFKSPPQF